MDLKDLKMDNYNINQEFRYRNWDTEIVLERHEFSEKIYVKELKNEFKKYSAIKDFVNKTLPFDFIMIDPKSGFDGDGTFIMLNLTIEAEENYDDFERITIEGEIENLIFNLTE